MTSVNVSERPNPIGNFQLERATAKQFTQLVADFTEWCRQGNPPAPLAFQDGWTIFTPETALEFLKHTVLGDANRKPSFNTVVYYATQMKAQDWQKTGQPIIVDTSGQGIDGQHRCWASLLTGVSFPTYVIASVPAMDNLFAYVDNVKARSASDALETAGMNGQSRLLSAVVRLARHYDANVMTPSSKGKVAKASPMDVMRYVTAHPELRNAVHLQTAEYQEATGLFLKDEVAAFIGWKIYEAHGEDVLDAFMTGLVAASTDGPNTVGDPLVALRKKLEAYAQNDNSPSAKKNTPAVHILAHSIKAFNAWRAHEAMRTVTVRVDERFPTFNDVVTAEAA